MLTSQLPCWLKARSVPAAERLAACILARAKGHHGPRALKPSSSRAHAKSMRIETRARACIGPSDKTPPRLPARHECIKV